MNATIWTTLITTLGAVATVLIQSIVANRNSKLKKQIEDLQVSTTNDINSVKEELKKDINNLKKDADEEVLNRCKSDLVTLMSRIRNGYKPTEEEKYFLYETKTIYNSKGGDSYVDSMFDGLKKEGLI